MTLDCWINMKETLDWVAKIWLALLATVFAVTMVVTAVIMAWGTGRWWGLVSLFAIILTVWSLERVLTAADGRRGALCDFRD
jgi:hypothetical protein